LRRRLPAQGRHQRLLQFVDLRPSLAESLVRRGQGRRRRQLTFRRRAQQGGRRQRHLLRLLDQGQPVGGGDGRAPVLEDVLQKRREAVAASPRLGAVVPGQQLRL